MPSLIIAIVVKVSLMEVDMVICEGVGQCPIIQSYDQLILGVSDKVNFLWGILLYRSGELFAEIHGRKTVFMRAVLSNFLCPECHALTVQAGYFIAS
jgi:hypothetical protein